MNMSKWPCMHRHFMDDGTVTWVSDSNSTCATLRGKNGEITIVSHDDGMTVDVCPDSPAEPFAGNWRFRRGDKSAAAIAALLRRLDDVIRTRSHMEGVLVDPGKEPPSPLCAFG